MKALTVAIACLLLAPATTIAASSGTGKTAQGKAVEAKAVEGKSQRYQLVYQLVKKWGPYVQEAYKTDVHNWTREMQPIFNSASLEKLQGGVDARTFDGMNNAVLGIASAGPEITPAALGDATSDLVYTPVAPCRLLDTRLAGGAIAANTVRGFDLNEGVTSYASQGGSNTNCGGVGGTNNIAAAVINFTTVSPVGAGYITAYAVNTPKPLSSSLNYAGGTGEIKGNEVIVPVDQTTATFEFNVYSLKTTHLVGDIVGYFSQPAPTALECVNVETSTSVAAGSSAFNYAICAASYNMTGGGCFWESAANEGPIFPFPSSSQRTYVCAGYNQAVVSRNLYTRARCCRVPGG